MQEEKDTRHYPFVYHTRLACCSTDRRREGGREGGAEGGRTNISIALRKEVSDQAGHDGDKTIPERQVTEGLREPLGGEAPEGGREGEKRFQAREVPPEHQHIHIGKEAKSEGGRGRSRDLPLVMLTNHPSLKRREQQRRGHAGKEAPKHQYVIVIHQLDQAGDAVKHRIHDTHLLPPKVISEGTHKRAGHHGREEAPHIEHGNVPLLIPRRRKKGGRERGIVNLCAVRREARSPPQENGGGRRGREGGREGGRASLTRTRSRHRGRSCRGLESSRKTWPTEPLPGKSVGTS